MYVTYKKSINQSYLCPDSWANVIPSIRPLSWPMLAELGKLHIPLVLVRPVVHINMSVSLQGIAIF